MLLLRMCTINEHAQDGRNMEQCIINIYIVQLVGSEICVFVM
jgi:hypothetical protein